MDFSRSEGAALIAFAVAWYILWKVVQPQVGIEGTYAWIMKMAGSLAVALVVHRILKPRD